MSKIISLDETDEILARRVRAVEDGEECVLTRDGQPVGKVVPLPRRRVLTPEQEEARIRMRAIMEEGWELDIEHPLDRDALHERR